MLVVEDCVPVGLCFGGKTCRSDVMLYVRLAFIGVVILESETQAFCNFESADYLMKVNFAQPSGTARHKRPNFFTASSMDLYFSM